MGNMQELCAQTPPPNRLKESLCITMVNNMPIVRGNFNFNKQATFKKIEDGALEFCKSNDIDEGYAPLVSRIIAYKQTHLFNAFIQLPQNSRARYLDVLSSIDIELMDSLFVHLVKNREILLNTNVFKEIKVPPAVEMNNLTQNQIEGLRNVGMEVISERQVAIVFMCGGSSKKNSFQDKFLSKLSPSSKSTPLSLFFSRLHLLLTSVSHSTRIPIVIACSPSNRSTLEQYMSSNDYFSFDNKYIKFITIGTLPILDSDGKYCLNFECGVESRPEGTATVIDEIGGKYLRGFFQYTGVKYVQIIGMENLAEQPGDPLMLGLLKHLKMKIVAKCTSAIDPYENHPRYAQSSQNLHLLSSQELSLANDPSLLKLAPIAMNCMLFDLPHLYKIQGEFESQLVMSKKYRYRESLQNYYDFTLRRPAINRKCYFFQKDIRDWISCTWKNDIALMKVNRRQFVSVGTAAQIQSAWESMGGKQMEAKGKIKP